MVVRAIRPPYTLQLIDREYFRSANPWDLPGPLVHDCFHWLLVFTMPCHRRSKALTVIRNLKTGDVYITQRKKPWPECPFKGYTVKIADSCCTRRRMFQGKSMLESIVSPSSPLFSRAMRILDCIEHPQWAIMTHSSSRHVQIELPRLQVLFYVNQNNLLQSPQLQCEVDPNQDAGTWYGLRSQLVCRSATNPLLRTILVPLGRLITERQGHHVIVNIEPGGTYGRYQINTTLGQIECAPEPVLIYLKALLHAYTSFIIPDPLTRRTGTEEAILWLQSGICQPWAPIGPAAMDLLQNVAALTPKREYYPSDLRVMRSDYWKLDLPFAVQDSRLRSLVDRILDTSNKLKIFTPNDADLPQLPSVGPRRLHQRAILRQQTLERCLENISDREQPVPRLYKSRDGTSAANIRHRNVLEITSLIRAWPRNLKTTVYLSKLLERHNSVGNFNQVFDKVSVNDRLKVEIVQSWGSLVRFAREQKDPYSLIFMFAPISFNLEVDLSLVRTLVAFSILEDLRKIPLPPWDDFLHFQGDQSPQVGYFLSLLKPFQSPMPKSDMNALEAFASAKQRKALQTERSKFNAMVEDDTKYFAEFLLKQWPCLEPKVAGLTRSVLLDAGAALQAIRPEWRRLYQNMELARHLQAVQVILDRRTCDDSYSPPEHVRSEEIYPTRYRGNETLDLNQLLLKPMLPTEQPPTLISTNKISSGNPPTMMSGNVYHNFVSSSQTGTAKQSLAAILSEPPAILDRLPTAKRLPAHTKTPASAIDVTQTISDLGLIVERLAGSRSSVKKLYAADLRQSLESFRDSRQESRKRQPMAEGSRAITRKMQQVHELFESLQKGLSEPAPGYSARRIEWLKVGHLWPIITKGSVLRQVGSTATQKEFGSGTRQHIIQLGVELTNLQRENRLQDLMRKKEFGRYQEELANEGHTNWKPEEHPDWLLLEIESNMMIRPVQIDVALATISPASGSNSVLQMNMGQGEWAMFSYMRLMLTRIGKTSCIIPMAAAALANKKQLVRVIVPKALLQQTGQLLQARLGGILNRQLRHVPFSRRTPTTEDTIKAYHAIHKDMLKSAGIMLCQPEHNLSFMLSGRQRLLDNQTAQAGPMINVNSWLTRHSRDVLDESDYTLAVRTQLIYPSGTQSTVDGHPHRWQVAEAILRLVNAHMYELPYTFPHSIEVVRRQGGDFPLMYFLRHDVEDELVRRVTADICRGLEGILPMSASAMTPKERVAIKDFISAGRPRVSSIEAMRNICPDRPYIRQTAYLLRGLLVNRILMMTLKKRWNVQYGLHPQRDPIAVPFHAKGVPSEQSEWGHPDVAILFTCLAFYYDGVSIAQLRQCVDHVLKSDDPSTEYDKWTQNTENFPSSLKAWNSINAGDEMQLTEIWKAVRYKMIVIDYFLNNFVFPRHAKHFKVKLQSNGWDIPLFPLSEGAENGETRKPLTTGFSGTNDNRTMLPLNVKQRDLPSLSHTSAEVLTYLLHRRNRRCVLPRDMPRSSSGRRATEIDLLVALKQRHMRVLIDAGAQILEMDNYKLAEEWLRIDGTALAALYFDEGNKPWILSKAGKKTPLLASPFADDLNQCLVYLDEVTTSIIV